MWFILSEHTGHQGSNWADYGTLGSRSSQGQAKGHLYS
jgi:hypothetical protein